MQSSDTDVRWQENVICDLCGGTEHESIRRDTTYGFVFVRCRSCSLMFYSPRYDEAYVVDRFLRAGNAEAEAESMFNRGVFFGEPEGGAEKQKAALRDYYRLLLKEHAGWYSKLNGRAPDSLFEAGASVGWYLKVAREEFLIGSEPLVQGCDANTFSAKWAREGFGLDVLDGTFLQYPIGEHQKRRFALASMLDYIEHTYTPLQDLKKIHSLTAPGGVLILKTFLEELDPKGAFVHPIFHAHHFTETTLRRALDEAGWNTLVFDMERERVYSLVTVFAERRA